MSKKINICLVGGEDSYKRIDLSQHLIADNFNVTILGTKQHNFPRNINFIKYNLNRKFNLISDFKTIIEYRQIIKKNSFDIIQTFDTKPAFLLPIAAIGLNTKIVRTITGLGTIFMGNSFKFKIYRFLYKTSHLFIKNKVKHTTFQNEDDRNYFLTNKLVSKENSSLIYGSGIDLNKINKKAERKNIDFTFLLVARLVYEKGVINYLEAAKICKKTGHNFNFLLVGPLEEDSTKLNKEILNSYKDVVTWVGPKPDALDYMLKADCFVLPTFREGFSRVLLESSAIGLPMITTNVPGTREIVTHEKEGLLVNVNNSQELANAMIRLTSDKNLADKMAINSIKKVKQFSLNVISKEYTNLYKNIA
ncbi:MAG: glycosyltransferase family 4 protein [Cellulophaga sp.]|uniref:glycosyltransferase family 4 protein n=1 Tax=unclassified Cellulophaga TaxID=2634405 RepID=UPI0026E1C533|nr:MULTISPECIES: glycosyltransferase family 4 protein [unclassified Cellulophaga]MDO6491486.1 glycosyltransferase family 4 protein [Cellulophaga sp. 2_MG-2023]MDO6493363.1 glycosyltransferase family 4 protein [Cellulophaga sp. 3_MG-2023]